PDWPSPSWVWLNIATLEFLIEPRISTWFFQAGSGKNCVDDEPNATANAPSSAITSGGLALESSARHAASPAAELVAPLLHQSFWPNPCKPAAIAVLKLFMAVDHAASVGYLLEAAEYVPCSGKLRQLSACTPSAAPRWLAVAGLTASIQYPLQVGPA